MFHGDLAAKLHPKSWYFENHNMFTPRSVLFFYIGLGTTRLGNVGEGISAYKRASHPSNMKTLK